MSDELEILQGNLTDEEFYVLVDRSEHVHHPGRMTEIVHTHAWATEAHTHAMRAVCRRPVCERCPTHNIHPAPDEWSNHAHAHQTPPGT